MQNKEKELLGHFWCLEKNRWCDVEDMIECMDCEDDDSEA